MAREHDLVMRSTTDTPEQMREGLGLEPAVPIDQVAHAQALLDKATADAAAAGAAADAEDTARELRRLLAAILVRDFLQEQSGDLTARVEPAHRPDPRQEETLREPPRLRRPRRQRTRS